MAQQDFGSFISGLGGWGQQVWQQALEEEKRRRAERGLGTVERTPTRSLGEYLSSKNPVDLLFPATPMGPEHTGPMNLLRAANPMTPINRSLKGWQEISRDLYDWSTTPSGEYWKEREPNVTTTPAPTYVPTLAKQPGDVTVAPATAGVTPSGPIVSGLGNLPPGALRFAQELKAAGYSDLAIAGALGNQFQESGWDYSNNTGDSGTAFGGFQWRNERQDALRQLAQSRGLDPASAEAQAPFTIQELNTTHTRARDALRAAQTPADAAAAWLHFLKPQGYNPEQFNPAAVHGWENRLAKTREIYNMLGGQAAKGNLLPLPVQTYQQGAPPLRPNPVDRPLPVAPDFGEQNQWLDTARPTAPDPAAMQKQVLLSTLSGLASGAAAVNPNQVGGTAQLLASMGAGAMGGRFRGEETARTENEAFQQALQQYGLQRADVAGRQAGTFADVRNQGADIGWQNRTADQDTGFANQATQYEVGERNRQASFEDRQKNDQALQDWIKTGIGAGRGEVLSATQSGLIFKRPDGSIEMKPWPQQGDSIYKTLANISDMPASLQGPATAENLSDPLQIQQMAITQAVQSGQGPGTFGEGLYNQAVEAADALMETSGVLPGEEAYKPTRDQFIAAQLQQLVAGNGSWIPKAQFLGNSFARRLAAP